LPFKHAWITGYCVDEKGEKMSKSKGNVIDPIPILERHGADIFRFWSATEASLGADFRASERRIETAGKFLTKLWNIARFISSFPQPKKVELRPTDIWILSELDKLIHKCEEGYSSFNFFIPATAIREFTWNIFAAHYIEMIKSRAYANDKSAWYTLHHCLKTILLLLAPITPFITEKIWNALYSKKSIHVQRFPKPSGRTKYSKITKQLLEFNSKIWNEKKRRGLSLRETIKIKIPKELQPFADDLRAMHNIGDMDEGK
jgi:valyl-tRNA synthetase